MEKILLLCRGVSGSGKSSLAMNLADVFYLAGMSVEICEADQFFFNKKGEYVFDPRRLTDAHNFCRDKCLKFLESGVDLVVVSNTSVHNRDVSIFQSYAERFGYRFISLIVENRSNTKDVHNVPKETIIKQDKTLRNNIRLY